MQSKDGMNVCRAFDLLKKSRKRHKKIFYGRTKKVHSNPISISNSNLIQNLKILRSKQIFDQHFKIVTIVIVKLKCLSEPVCYHYWSYKISPIWKTSAKFVNCQKGIVFVNSK